LNNSNYNVVSNACRAGQLLILCLTVHWWLECDTTNAAIAAIGLLICCAAMPFIKKPLSAWVHATIVMHLFVGLHFGMYEASPFYDEGAHIFSMGGIVLIVLMQLNQYSPTRALVEQQKIRIAIAATVALALGAAWELIEFSLDTLFALNAQQDLLDTNLDLLADLAGGILAFLLFTTLVRPTTRTVKESWTPIPTSARESWATPSQSVNPAEHE